VSGTRSYGDPDAVARSLDILGERWSLLVVRELLLGPKRFNDLLGGLARVSPNVLSQRLRELSDHGVVRRWDLGAPARVHVYELTEWGHELEPVLLELERWGARAPQAPDGELSVDSLMLSVKAAFNPARSPRARATYEVIVDGDTFALEIVDGLLTIRRTTVIEPDATITTNRHTLRALRAGQLAVADALRSGDLRLTGDPQPSQHLTELLTTPPARQ
jgi:DNA-binding HxlR family transcriptional regulator